MKRRERGNGPCASCGVGLDEEPMDGCEYKYSHFDPEDDEDENNWEDDGDIAFADPGGRSALRAATPDNPRDRPCPDCGAPNVLTPADVILGYRCDRCADLDEGVGSPWGAP